MWERVAEAGRYPPRKTPSELRRIILPESRGYQSPCHRRPDGLAGAGLRKNDVPEVYIGVDEGHAHESSFPLLTQGSDDAVHGLSGMLVENFDGLAGDQRSIHEYQGAVGGHDVSGGFQVDSFAFRQAATYRQRNLKGNTRSAPALGIASSLHKATWKGHSRLRPKM